MTTRFRMFAAALVVAAGPALADSPLETVIERGSLRCGVQDGLPGFSSSDGGAFAGFDVDICRSVARGLSPDLTVEFVTVNARGMYDALAAGEVDLLVGAGDPSFGPHALKAQMVAATYVDGVGALVPKDYGVSSLHSMDGGVACLVEGSQAVPALQAYLTDKRMNMDLSMQPDFTKLKHAQGLGCDLVVADAGQLASLRTVIGMQMMPEVFGTVRRGVVVSADDPTWAAQLRWIANMLIAAEAWDGYPGHSDPSVVGLEAANLAAMLEGGSYGQLFDRNLGDGSPLGLYRGLNASYQQGGVMVGLSYQ